jgi:precorrin isomerase
MSAASARFYQRDPAAIYRESVETIRREVDLSSLPLGVADLALRLIHACGMVDLIDDLAFRGEPTVAGREALARRAPVLVDTKMVAAGIGPPPSYSRVVCTLGDHRVAALAAELGTTRSAAAVELWRPLLPGAIVAIGNAPTALFHLLDGLELGWPRPAVIFAFPVGFVGAAEAKQALVDADLDVPYVTVRGRRGGSSLAAASVNALVTELP